MNCPNCGALLTCGCQRKLASDGTQCCSSCVKDYESKQRAKKAAKLKAEEPIVTTITATSIT